MRNRSWKSQRGYTTAEILAATSIALVVSAAFVNFNHYQMHVVQDQAKQLAVQETVRSVLDVFTREVRRAGQNPTCAVGITPIVGASRSYLRIQADLNGDGVIAAANEDVTYNYNLAILALERITNNVADVLVTETALGAFRYFDAAGNELIPEPTLTGAQILNVRRVRFEVALSRVTMQNGSAVTLKSSAATDINLRNRFFVSAVTCS